MSVLENVYKTVLFSHLQNLSSGMLEVDHGPIYGSNDILLCFCLGLAG